jgi:HK97 family phage portal protein
MGIAEGVLALRGQHRPQQRAWPVGPGVVDRWESSWGHADERFSPEEYGDYIATSSEIYSVAQLRARLVSTLDLNLYRGRGAEKTAMPKHPAAALLRHVNPFWTAPRLARMDELSMCLWGESYWAVERDPRGRPVEIWWLKPSRVRPLPHAETYLTGYVYEPIQGGPLIHFDADEIVWFRYPNPIDELSALSPLTAARLAADAGKAMMESNRNLFSNGLQMAGLITPPADKVTFSAEQAEELEAKLARRFTGADKRHKWAVLRYEAQFRQLDISPKDAEFANGLNLTLRQVCSAYGLPSALVNDLGDANMAILDGLVKAMWAHTLVPDTGLRAAEIEEQFLPRFGAGGPDHAAYDYGSVPALQESASDQWAREAQALDRGRYTINEIRRRNGEPDVPWGDVWWAPVNKFAVTDADSQPPAGPDAPPDDEMNPANQPAQVTGETVERGLDHNAARRLLASLTPVNGHAHVGGGR